MNNKGVDKMPEIDDIRRLGAEMERILNLQNAPVGLKVLYKGDEIPSESVRPYRDTGKHYAPVPGDDGGTPREGRPTPC